MHRSRLFPIVLSLMTVPALPLATRALAVQQNTVAGQPLDPNYADQEGQERRDQLRKEEEARHSTDVCELGCGDYEGLQSRGIPDTPFVAVLHKAELDDGVLTMRLRFYNEGSEPARLAIDPSVNSEAFFVRIGREKLFILKDGDGELEAKDPLEVDLKPGEMESWWAKFPAPPAGTEEFDLEIPPVATFRAVPVADD